MYCSKCGTVLPDDAVYCSNCGQTTTRHQSFGATTAAVPAVGAQRAYAGFWLRVVAYIFDGFVLGFFIALVVIIPLFGTHFTGFARPFPEIGREIDPRFRVVRFASLLSGWLYYALLESSAWQATLGKKALGLEVTDLQGRRISFARATGRYFGMIVSAIILMIGFLMAGFTEKKQALHDMMAGCLVIKKI